MSDVFMAQCWWKSTELLLSSSLSYGINLYITLKVINKKFWKKLTTPTFVYVLSQRPNLHVQDFIGFFRQFLCTVGLMIQNSRGFVFNTTSKVVMTLYEACRQLFCMHCIKFYAGFFIFWKCYMVIIILNHNCETWGLSHPSHQRIKYFLMHLSCYFAYYTYRIFTEWRNRLTPLSSVCAPETPPSSVEWKEYHFSVKCRPL